CARTMAVGGVLRDASPAGEAPGARLGGGDPPRCRSRFPNLGDTPRGGGRFPHGRHPPSSATRGNGYISLSSLRSSSSRSLTGETQMRRTLVLLAALAVGAALPAAAQTPAPAQSETAQPLAIGASAPDFSLPGATRFGVLQDPVRLSDFKAKTVVLAFI